MALKLRLLLLVLAVGLGTCTYDRSADDDDGEGEGESPDAGIPPEPRDVRLVDWNVHDLFDTVADPGTDDSTPSEADLAAKLEAIGVVLRELDPDVLALQEVEHESLLDRLVADELGAGYDQMAFVEGFDPRGIDVGLVARLPITDVVSHLEERFPGVDGTGNYGWSRDSLEVHIDVSGRDLVVLVNHLISKSDPENDDKRAAQARHARALAEGIVAQSPLALVAVVGDMNDLPDSPTIEALLGEGFLVDSAADLPADESWTFIENGRRERIDYVTVVPALSAMQMAVSTHRDDPVPDASDHNPIVVDFHVTP